MDDTDSIPPLIQSKISFARAAKPQAPSGFQRVAQICWVTSVFALLCIASGYWLKGIESGAGHLALVGATILLCCLSIFLGIIALCGIPKHGTSGILLGVLMGVVVSGSILTVKGAKIASEIAQKYQSVVRARTAQSVQRQAVQETHDDSKKETNGSNTPSSTTA